MINYPKKITNKIIDVKTFKKPSNKTLVMCHGTFDVVHPGHIRHLIYAKDQGDLLIASLTADKFITKGEEKPYIPEELRARNLASLEMVDYVLIDYNEEPVSNILEIKPDFFVKGFEYSSDGIHPKTKKEIDAVQSYGGKLLFSPGDFVRSSTKFLTVKKPKLTIEKLVSIMDAEKISFKEIDSAIDSFKDIDVHVIGDTIVDKYVYTNILGPTTKTPTFSVKRISDEIFVGGAAIVAKHLKGLGANVTFTTVMGDDELKDFVIDDLEKYGVQVNVHVDKSRPTTLKERFWAEGYKLLQVNTLENNIISNNIQNKIINQLNKSSSELFVFSDFRHGIFNKQTIEKICKSLPKNVVKVGDSQVSNRWGNILDFQKFDLIIPNEKEARFALADQDSGVRPLGTAVFHKSNANFLILKLGEKGIMVFRDSAKNPRDFFTIESFVQDFKDGIGAGDALLAAASISYCTTKNIVISSILGNISAALACEVEGNVPVTVSRIKSKLNEIKSSKNFN